MKIKFFFNKLKDRLIINNYMVKYTNLLLKSLELHNSNDIVLFEYTSSYSVLITYYHIIKVLNKKKLSTFKYINNNYIQMLDRLKIPNRNFDFFFNTIMEDIDTENFKNNNIDKKRIMDFVKKIKSKGDIVNYKINNLLVGDLIYDTYLKWNKKETIDLKDINGIYRVFLKTHFLYNQAVRIYQSNKIKYYFAGDIAYIYSGVIARYLTSKDVKVVNFIESAGLNINFLDKKYFYRREKYWLYSSEKIMNLAESRKISKNTLDEKLNKGKQQYIYMKSNTFANDKMLDEQLIEKLKDINFKVLIPLHCFMDSPHLYRWFVYPDFYEWIVKTLKILEEIGIKAIIKPHPNGFPENDKIVLKLKKMFPNHFFIDKNISNRIFTDILKVNVVLTVYGSVGYEFPYFNIPVIAAGDNPHVAFSFVQTCHTQREYENYLTNIKNFGYQIDKNEIYDFYFLHYINKNEISGINPIYPIEPFVHIINKDYSPQKQREIYHHNNKVLKLELDLIKVDFYETIEKKIEKQWFNFNDI